MSNLTQMQKGQLARISSILGEDGLHFRLMEIGFIPGRCIEFLRSAPLGDPVEFFLNGSRIALRKADAAQVLVELVSAEAA